MTLYTTYKSSKEIIAVTDSFGLFNVIGTGAFSKIFKSFDEVKKNYKCFSEASDFALIDYDLDFKSFVEQFENGSKECDDLKREIAKWKSFKDKLKTLRK